jgi:hypothetical protein
MARDIDELLTSYLQQIVGLVDGGDSDVLIVETIFEKLNAEAALFAIGEYPELSGQQVGIQVFSMTRWCEWPHTVCCQTLCVYPPLQAHVYGVCATPSALYIHTQIQVC